PEPSNLFIPFHPVADDAGLIRTREIDRTCQSFRRNLISVEETSIIARRTNWFNHLLQVGITLGATNIERKFSTNRIRVSCSISDHLCVADSALCSPSSPWSSRPGSGSPTSPSPG